MDFERDGYVIVPDLLRPDELAAARTESVAVCRGSRGAIDGSPRLSRTRTTVRC